MHETTTLRPAAHVAAWYFFVCSLVLAATALWAGLAPAAPAPVVKTHAKPVEPLAVWGDWTKTFGGGTYDCWFRDDATYGTLCGWHGTYTVSGRTLTVREAFKQSGDYWTWSVTLDGALKGTAREVRDDQRPGTPNPVTLRRR